MNEPRRFLLPINQCLMHARQKLMDSAYIRAKHPDRGAAAQGWKGDIEITIAAFLASPACDFRA